MRKKRAAAQWGFYKVGIDFGKQYAALVRGCHGGTHGGWGGKFSALVWGFQRGMLGTGSGNFLHWYGALIGDRMAAGAAICCTGRGFSVWSAGNA